VYFCARSPIYYDYAF
nr:immunoglobulin heavy chain junction region [Mus musculus]